MTALLALLLLTPSAGEELEKAKRDFRQALADLNPTSVRDAADRIARTESKEAVDALLNGCLLCATMTRPLWADKVRLIQEMDVNGDFRINTSTNPPTVEPGDVNKYHKFQQAQKDAQLLEKRIMTIEEVKRGILQALARFRNDAAVKELCHELKTSSNWARRVAVAEALAQVPHADVPAALADAIRKDSEPQVRIAALDAVRERKLSVPDLVAAAVDQLKHEFWQVRSTAVAALKALSARDAVEPLVDALQKNDGRLKHEINDALIALTGVDKHGDAGAWKAWWESNKAAFKSPGFQPRPDEAAANDPRAGTTFYGIPVKSKNVIFILDRSGSMAEPSEWNIPADVSTGRPPGGVDVKREGDRKIDIARWQLKRALAMLPDGVEFNLIFFNHEWTIMTERMVKLNGASRRTAFEFIDKLDPVGGTNCYDPLEKGLSYAAAGAMAEKIARLGVDTIFFLTDGMPNSGQVPNADDIVTKVKDLNKTRKVKINTVGVFSTPKGAVPASMNEADLGGKFLKQLAEESAGSYTSANGAKK